MSDGLTDEQMDELREIVFGVEMTAGVELIASERQRQIHREGWTPEHDDEHADNDLAVAAALYAVPQGVLRDALRQETTFTDWHKFTPDDRVRELVKAGALIAAEIDRRLRGSASEPDTNGAE